ncbi:MAG: sugar phosphate isomerase/epimerase [Oscillospiraceae bacterium]|nr:sugar phosphate isomerase/epimerase [Oscillospiraceae bacterium]
MKIGIQLYSVRQAMEKDFYGTLERVKQAGYDGVEFAGYYGQTAEDVKAALDKLGLVACSTHTNVGDPQKAADFEKKLGNKNIVCPGLPSGDAEKLGNAIATLRNAAEVLEPQGLRVGYHNHSHEFEKIDGEYIFDAILREIPSLLCEIDVGWAHVAGVDPAGFMRKHSGRVEIIHLKDIGENGRSTEIGSGNVDMPGVVEAAKECGTEWLIVEQEDFEGPPMFESIKISCDAVKKMIEG